ncbi:uncharacterized protein METZ01_LOCUS162515, partial [marine metagenome]
VLYVKNTRWKDVKHGMPYYFTIEEDIA